MRRTLVCLALAGALLAGCGDDESPSPTTNEAPAPATTEASAPSRAAGKRIAADAVLELRDLPNGWTAKDTGENDETAKCDSIEAAKRDALARDTSSTFEKDDDQVEHSVYVFATEELAERHLAAASGAETRRCVRDGFRDSIAERLEKSEPGVDVGEVESGELSVDPAGDETAASRFVVPFSYQGLDVEATIDVIFTRAGRGLSFLLLAGATAEFDADLRSELTRTAGRRLENAVGS